MVNNSELFPVHTRLCIILPAVSEGYAFHGFFKYRKLSATEFSALVNYFQILLCSLSVPYTFFFLVLDESTFTPELTSWQCQSVPYIRNREADGASLAKARRGGKSNVKIERKIELIYTVTRVLE